MASLPRGVLLIACLLIPAAAAWAQPAPESDVPELKARLAELNATLDTLKQKEDAERYVPDVEVYAKAVDWILRHNEFYKPEYAKHALAGLKTGSQRAAELSKGSAAQWETSPGRKILGYRSRVDESIQPYALTLPADFGKEPEKRWPLHLVLHGRGATLNEVSFIQQHDNKPVKDEQTWIQLDVFGRTNNAYRWSGETDVFEALADVKRRYRIDDRRIVLHGFSMGGAGSWHIGLHYPSLWCSVGPGAGFVDFYKYQKAKEPLPAHQDRALHIYNAIDYALNAADVPVCTYGGELDPQLAASTEMVATAEKLGVPIKILIGPGVEHKFHPETQKEFMAWHLDRQKEGRKPYPGATKLRFVTHTLKYNTCEWLTIEEMQEQYKPATVEAEIDPDTGVLKLKTQNVAVLQLARDIAEYVEIDGTKVPLAGAADGLLPGVYYDVGKDKWYVQNYDSSLNFPKNLDLRKRHNLQGPIDDAFMEPFVCVRGTGKAWDEAHEAWAKWTLDRFSAEFDKWLRGKVPVVNDTEVTQELIQSKNLILFGDPGSNTFLAKIYKRLPIRWTKGVIEVNNVQYDPDSHGLALIYPNPLNSRRYVVLNSGHTFHEDAFKASNAWLFPRLGDIAVQKFEKLDAGGYKETTLWADFFDTNWKYPQK